MLPCAQGIGDRHRGSAEGRGQPGEPWVVGSRRPLAEGELLAKCWKGLLKMGDAL